MREQLVMVGNGMAGARTLEELLQIAPDKYEITVFGAEPCGNYNRILLSHVLSGDKPFQDTVLNNEAWYAERGIRLYPGKTVVALNRNRREVIATDSTTVHYDRLILATGSRPPSCPDT